MASSTISTTIGSTASSMVGARGPGRRLRPAVDAAGGSDIAATSACRPLCESVTGTESTLEDAPVVLGPARPHDQGDDAREQDDDKHPAGQVTRHRRSPHTGSRVKGHVMQCPPPRPFPSSNPSIVMTSTPASRILAIVYVFRS